MNYTTKIKEIEIHPTSATMDETDKRWSVMVYGEESLTLFVDEIEINAEHKSGFKNPKAKYSDAFTYVVFDKPVGMKREDNKLIVE